jgi:hypothetical protein
MTRISKIETYQVTKADLKEVFARELKVDPSKIGLSFMVESGKRTEPPKEIYDLSHIEVRVNG